MKKLFWAMCWLVSPVLLHAQVLLQGTVVDSISSEPLAGVSLRLQTGAGTMTDAHGSFWIHETQTGHYTLTVSSVGFRTATVSVNLSAGQNTVRIGLVRINLFLQPIEVKALRAGSKAPFSATNLDKKDLEQNNVGQDIPYLLDQTPSVVINSNSGNGIGYTGLSIRGTDPTRINVTLNGIPMNDAEDQGVYFVDLPDLASSISSIQVQRGVGTSTNGAGAFGASINLSTNEFNENPYGAIDASVGSYGSWRTMVKAGSGLIDDHFTIDARVSVINSQGYVDRGFSDLKSLYLSGAYLSQNTSLRFNLISGTEKTYQTWDGVPGAKLFGSQSDLQQYYDNNVGSSFFTPGDSVNLFGSDRRKYNYFTYPDQTDNYWQDYYQLFFNHKINSRWDLNLGAFLTRGYGYYIEYSPQQSYAAFGLPNPVYNGDTLQTTDLIQQLWLNNWYYGGIANVQYHAGKDQVITGGGWSRYDGEHYGIVTWAQAGFPNDYRYYYNVANKTDWNAYIKWQHRFNATWSSFLDLQDRVIRYYINGFDDNPGLNIHKGFNFFNPKAGISFTGNEGWSGYASLALAGHEPNRSDFEANEQQQPKAEHLADLEVSIGKKRGPLSWNATLYYMHYRDQLVLTGKINDVGEYTRSNIPKSYRAGVELQASWKPVSWFDASANLSLSRNRISQFTEYLDDYDNGTQKVNRYNLTDIALSPDIIGGAVLSVSPARTLTVSLISKYAGRQYLDNTSHKDRSLDPFFYENARVIWKLPQHFFREVQLIGMAYNIFNARYEPNGYTGSYISNQEVITNNFYFPAATVNYMCSVNITL